MVEFFHIESGPDLDVVRTLFLEYAKSLNFALCFQGFDLELANLPGEYAGPYGQLILCRVDGTAAGCIALKRLFPDVCEMKRLYVRPEFRGHELGRKLAFYLIQEACESGYRLMRLDTISVSMPHAVALYRSLGFKEIPPYYDNPISGAVFMELSLE